MDIGKALEATILYTASDGRKLFRPWGAKGPCYLVDTMANIKFRWFVRFYFSLLIISILIIPFIFGLRGLFIGLGVWMIGFHLASWALSRGLPKTDPPPIPTPDQRDAALANLTSLWGRPIILIFFVLSILMILASLVVIFAGNITIGIVGFLFSGATAVLFLWWLRKSKAAYRDREEPHDSPLPHHAAYGSVLRGSADPRQVHIQGNNKPREEK